ncbi:MAG: flagellar biosynthesis protein FlgB [Alphaproteobacteria bacterium]
MLDRLALFDLIDRKLDFTDARHRVITRNIANADSPGFIPEDLVEPDFRRLVAGSGGEPVQLARTDPAHAKGFTVAPQAASEATPAELKPSGNAVSLEIEAGKLRSNSGEHKRATMLYGKYLTMMRNALGRGQ